MKEKGAYIQKTQFKGSFSYFSVHSVEIILPDPEHSGICKLLSHEELGQGNCGAEGQGRSSWGIIGY